MLAVALFISWFRRLFANYELLPSAACALMHFSRLLGAAGGREAACWRSVFYCRKAARSGSWQHENGIADPNAAVTALAGSYC